MPKINIKVVINNELENTNYEVKAIIQNNTIKYKEPDETITTYSYKDNTLIRENHELRMDYSFDKDHIKEGKIKVKELDKTINVKIKTNMIERKNHNIKVDFIVDGKSFIYMIEEIK